MSRRRTERKRLKKWLLIGVPALVGLIGIVCIGVWFSVAHVPAWYKPPYVPEAEYTRVRNSMLETVSDFGDRLVAGEPFELTLTDRQISEWIAVRSELWTEAEDWVPDFLQDPMIAFQPGRIILAARFTKDGWQAIASVHLMFDVTRDELIVHLEEVAAGSFRLPITMIAARLGPVLAAAGQDVDAMPDALAGIVRFFREKGAVEYLKNGVVVDNRFRWQVSKRWLRIRELIIEPGRLRMQVEPLAGATPVR